MTMMRLTVPVAVLMLAACSGGNDEKQAAGPPGDTVTAPVEPAAPVPAEPASGDADLAYIPDPSMRSEERRGGQECVRTSRSRWSPYHSKNKHGENSTEHCGRKQDVQVVINPRFHSNKKKKN